MNDYEITLILIAAALFAVMLALAAAECVREMHAEAIKRQRAGRVRPRAPRPLYVDDLRSGTGSAR